MRQIFLYRVASSLLLTSILHSSASAQLTSPSIIDVHRHDGTFQIPTEEWDAVVAQNIGEMDANNIRLAVLMATSPEVIEAYRAVAPDRFVFSTSFPCVRLLDGTEVTCGWDEGNWSSVTQLRDLIDTGKMGALGEMSFTYAGVPPEDPRMDPYWALAAERDIPVATHLGPGPPPGQGIRLICCPNFDETVGLPADFRPILERHPNLRLVLLHAGPSPAGLDLEYNAEVFALASEFPNVYFDMSVLQSVVPEDLMREFLLEVRRHGIMDRLVLGTDGLPADPIIRTFMNMDILTDAEKRGILHDNAARLLKLDE